MTTQKYFYYGSNSKYALVDSFNRNIWLLVDTIEIARLIRHAFTSKLNLIIVDITTYSNYESGLIDNSVCLNWKIPHTTNADLIENSLSKSVFDQVFLAKQGQQLLHEPCVLNLEVSRQQELVEQMMLLSQILDMLKDAYLEYTNLPKLFEIFQTEIDITVIKSRLLEYALDNINNNSMRSVKILYLLDKSYE